MMDTTFRIVPCVIGTIRLKNTLLVFRMSKTHCKRGRKSLKGVSVIDIICFKNTSLIFRLELVDQRYFSIDFAIYLKLQFCIENQRQFFNVGNINTFARSFKTLGFPLNDGFRTFFHDFKYLNICSFFIIEFYL